jgi:uncharacterized protein (DUF2141 family)
MARNPHVVFIALLLMGCAQVGTISGGPKDERAPAPILDKMVPASATVNYTGNSFEIPFDEYFQLNNPSQTIRMVPPHATVIAEMKKKTLFLSWVDTLEANTTYAIYLNGTVKDLNEGNDSTLQIVFSTGNTIDSISYSIAVSDAFSGEALDNMTVALFDSETEKLKSFSKTKNGVATLNYLSPGTYSVLAFQDENQNLEVDNNEMIGFPLGGAVTIDSSYFDSIPIRAYTPHASQKFEVKTFVSPAAFLLEHTASLNLYGLIDAEINGKKANFFRDLSKDAYYLVASDTLGQNPAQVVVSHQTDSTIFRDTLTYRFRSNERNRPVRITPLHRSSTIAPGDSLKYELFTPIDDIRDSMISVQLLSDSTFTSSYTLKKSGHSFSMAFDPQVSGSVRIQFAAGALQTPSGPNLAFAETVTLGKAEDFGTLLIDLSAYNEPILLELIQGQKSIRSIALSKPIEPIRLSNIPPGTYTFRVIRDTNQNKIWDIGNLQNYTQPERVDVYSKPIKVRANWEVEAPLNPRRHE